VVVWLGETVADPVIGYVCPAGKTEGEIENVVAFVTCQLMVAV
jgi:hypothetical protein